MASFGERVVGYREALGMSQKALAERAGLTPSHLNRIEKGTRPPPGVSKVVGMTQALRLTPAQAAELVQLAGYSAQVLHAGQGLAYASPSTPDPSTALLLAALSRLDPEQRQRSIEAFIAMIEALAGSQSTTTEQEGGHA